MDVRYSPEQEALRSSAVRIVDRLGPGAVAALDDTARSGSLGEAVRDSGWLALRQGEGPGTPLASGVEVAIVAEELGRGLADTAFAGPLLAADLRRRCGAAPADAVETVVLDPTLCELGTAAAPGGVAIDAQGAGYGLVLVGGDATGVRRLGRRRLGARSLQLDLTRPTAWVGDGDPVEEVPSRRGLDDEDLAAWSALGLAVTCADLVGVMRGAIALANDYAIGRRQFDVPVGSFQAVQHLLADAHVAMEGSRSVALHAAWAADALAPHEALAAAALAKAYCARAARQVCETSVQVHGGIGNTWDCLAHVFLRRALLSAELFGGAEHNVTRVLAYHGVPAGAGAGTGRGLR